MTTADIVREFLLSVKKLHAYAMVLLSQGRIVQPYSQSSYHIIRGRVQGN